MTSHELTATSSVHQEHDTTASERRGRMPQAVWAMVIGAFAMGADEFIVAGVVRR